jgi:DNA primase
MSLPETSQQQNQVSRQPLYDILEAAAQFFEQQLQSSLQRDKAQAYLQKRGLDSATIQSNGVLVTRPQVGTTWLKPLRTHPKNKLYY